MINCKCGRQIPDNAICSCGLGNTISTIVYVDGSLNSLEIFNQNDVNMFRQTQYQNGIQDFNYYRFLWQLLHTYKYESEEDAKIWFEAWKGKISCGSCKAHLEELLKALPTDYSSKEGFFKWTVEIHNMVNKKLGKVEISVEEAILLWQNTENQQ